MLPWPISVRPRCKPVNPVRAQVRKRWLAGCRADAVLASASPASAHPKGAVLLTGWCVMAIGAGQQAAISCQVISFAGARAEIVIGFGYAPLRRAGNSRHLDQAFNAIDAQKEAGHAVIKSQNPAWRGIFGQEKGPGNDPSPSIWWRWRESNPRPTTFRRSLYMRSQSLFFIESSRTGTDRFRLFTLGF